jgi:hypothetical protein
LAQLPAQLAREVAEEFGAQRARLLSRYIATPLDTIGLSLAAPGGPYAVYFVVCRVTVSLRELVGQVRDGAGGPADSPFDFVQAVGLLDALDEFRANAATGWFADGLKQVNKHKAILLA